MTYIDVLLIAAAVVAAHLIPLGLAYYRHGDKRFTVADKRPLWRRVAWALFGVDGTRETVFETPAPFGSGAQNSSKRKSTKTRLVPSTSRRLRKLKVAAMRSYRTGYFEPPVARATKR